MVKPHRLMPRSVPILALPHKVPKAINMGRQYENTLLQTQHVAVITGAITFSWLLNPCGLASADKYDKQQSYQPGHTADSRSAVV